MCAADENPRTQSDQADRPEFAPPIPVEDTEIGQQKEDAEADEDERSCIQDVVLQTGGDVG